MSVELEIYDLESAIEESVATLLRAEDLTVSTPQSDLEFQKTRPRLELMAMIQGGAGQLLPEAGSVRPAPGHMRETAWRAQLKVDLISALSIEQHRSYRSKVRNLFSKLATVIDMPRHNLNSIRDAGATPFYKGQEGYYQSTLLYDLDISVEPSAWTDLATEEAE